MILLTLAIELQSLIESLRSFNCRLVKLVTINYTIWN